MLADMQFSKEHVLGTGTFGKCFRGKLSHIDVCIKVLRKGADYQTTFATEATLLSHCCHPNLPWLYGVVHQPSIIISSLHTTDNSSIIVHSVLHGNTLTLSWKKIINSVILAIDYLHNKSILQS